MYIFYRFEQRAAWLGYAGVLPLLLGSVWIALDDQNGLAIEFFKNYAAVILTFVGAIHWGRAMYSQNSSLLSLSVLPSLFACVCLLLSAMLALPLLALGFISLMLLDYEQYRHIPHFRFLRLQLTTLVVVLLIATWLMLAY